MQTPPSAGVRAFDTAAGNAGSVVIATQVETAFLRLAW